MVSPQFSHRPFLRPFLEAVMGERETLTWVYFVIKSSKNEPSGTKKGSRSDQKGTQRRSKSSNSGTLKPSGPKKVPKGPRKAPQGEPKRSIIENSGPKTGPNLVKNRSENETKQKASETRKTL